VSTKFVFLFVLFGALLEKAGAGNYFIQMAFSLLGHLRGGPAKAAVVASGMTGLISGSSIANVVTTGTFTVPLMKRVGFTSEKAGAVEVASSVNGQIMPPVMGAAAFLMVEYVGIPYIDVIRHAFLPAIISYIALVYIVHLEAVKKGMEALPKPGERLPPKWQAIGFGFTVLAILILGGAAYWLIQAAQLLDASGWVTVAVAAVVAVQILFFQGLKALLPRDNVKRLVSVGAIILLNAAIGTFGLFHAMEVLKAVAGDATPWVVAVLLFGVYAALLWYASRFPELKLDDPNSPIVTLPEVGPTVKSGLHFLLPIGVLVWCLMIERLSPALSAFWATAFMIFILLTQRPLIALFRGRGDYGAATRQGGGELFDALVTGARNMIGIGIATATAGIVVGTVTLTGIGLVMAAFVEFLSGGNLLLMLVLVAVLSLILGMGPPTTSSSPA
jgi:TRAP transporter 4TM/12TM fusion protein